jgi:UDP-N-acetylglucosamine:LPS N-acetylglucosamine transferase
MTLSRAAMTKVDLFYFNAGGGHRAAALALQAVIAEQHRPWTVELVDLFEVLDPRGQFLRVTGMAPEAYYNMRLAKGWTLGLGQELRLLQGLIRLAHARLFRLLQQHWLKSEPDLVVSVIPNFNRVLCESLASALPGVPYVTVMTDLADYPPNFWIEADPRQHVICGTSRAVEQARGMGGNPGRIHAMSGMIIRPDFYRPVDVDRRKGLIELGLDPDRPTGLVLFGGHGSMKMLSIERQLRDVQLVLLCGHNATLVAKLQKAAGDAGAGRVVVGFTHDVRRYMQLCDFFIGKPGPGSMSEALQQGLPIVTVRNAWTMPQERYNTEWIVERGFGLVGSSMRAIRPTVVDLIGRLDEFRARVRSIENRAVFEVPDILQDILDRGDLDRGPAAVVAASQAS